MNHDDYLICLVDNEYFGFNLEVVQKIIECAPLTKIAGAPEYIDGAMSYEGELLKAVNLRRALGKKSSNDECQKMVVIKSHSDYYGLKVDGIDVIVPIDNQSLKSHSGKSQIGIFEVSDVIEIGGKLVSVVKNIKV